ncbi:MAG: flagellar export protein FliJ [Rhodospirillales bacterium]|tara:strand:+ start:850 stop:1293 length:444 start_codon:yes stop_codon:yes gene_type:complete
MAAGLKNLIRLHEWTVDERRRELGQHIRLLNEMDQRVRDLEAELKREQALAGAGEMGITFGAYYNLFRYRRAVLDGKIRAKEREILEARDILGRAYMELKKYQVADDIRKREAALEETRQEQAELDEMGLQLYRRQSARRKAAGPAG